MRAGAWLCLALLSPSPGSADECDQLPPPSVSVKRLDEQVALNTQYSYKTLNNLGAPLARPGQQILGLTRGKAVVEFASKTPSYIDRSGRWECASPQLVLTYGFKPMTVFVAREFPADSCAYKEIHAHELRHVKAYREHVASIEKELAATLGRRFATGGPWRGPARETQARLQQELNERWIPYVNREIARVDAAQALIDTPEEYTRVADSCGGEIRKRLQ